MFLDNQTLAGSLGHDLMGVQFVSLQMSVNFRTDSIINLWVQWLPNSMNIDFNEQRQCHSVS